MLEKQHGMGSDVESLQLQEPRTPGPTHLDLTGRQNQRNPSGVLIVEYEMPDLPGTPSRKLEPLHRGLLAKGDPTYEIDTNFELWRKSLFVFALATAGFMVGLDQTIIGMLGTGMVID
jgi:hypothetical protein